LSPCLWPQTVNFLDVATGACDYWTVAVDERTCEDTWFFPY
jgi:hypothetical protein